MADYKHDIFISYRNVSGVREWVRDVFYPELERKLYGVLDREPSIFLDRHMVPSTWWASSIPDALHRSRLAIVVLAPLYDSSAWCRAELACMEEREKLLNRHKVPGSGLVIPVAYSARQHLSPHATQRQFADFSDHTYCGKAFRDSERYLDFEDQVKKLASLIANLLNNQFPPWDPNWPIIDPATITVDPQPAVRSAKL